PEDFDKTLSDSSPNSNISDQTYYEPDAKDFVIRDRFKYIHSQNGTLLEDSQLFFSDNELMMDDSSSSYYTYSLLQQEEAQLLSWKNAIESMFRVELLLINIKVTDSLRLKESIIIESILNKFKLHRYTKKRKIEESAASSPSPPENIDNENIEEEEGALEN
ncbi:32344_t:CDS:2, partial [Racocetra persica]